MPFLVETLQRYPEIAIFLALAIGYFKCVCCCRTGRECECGMSRVEVVERSH